MSEGMTPEAVHEAAVEKAKQLHWVPKEEYTGDPAKWRDAEEFLEFGERVLPIVQENNKRLMADNTALKNEIAAIRAEVAKFAKVHEQTEKAAYAQALADLRDQRKTALAEGDYDLAEEVTEKIEVTKQAQVVEPAAKPAPQEAVIPQEVQTIYDGWAKENQWAVEGSESYDMEMEAYAKGIGDALVKKQGVKSTGADFRPFLDQISKRVKARFPEKFGNPARRAAASMEGGDAGDATPSSKKTYANLPKEAKESCDFLVETGTFANREEYLKKYQW